MNSPLKEWVLLVLFVGLVVTAVAAAGYHTW